MNREKFLTKKTCDMATSIVGTVTVGSKGQIVIPKDVRNELEIQEGDKLMVMTKGGMAVGFVKSDNLSDFIAYMQREVEEDFAIMSTK